MIGFSAPSRIFINENLTKKNFEIFCLARDLKKDGKINYYSTQRGRVSVKLTADAKQIVIGDIYKLKALVDRQQQSHNNSKQQHQTDNELDSNHKG